MSDTASGLSSVQAWMSNIETTMNNLPSEMQAAVPSGSFASVLAGIQALFSSPTSASPLASTATASNANGTISAQLSDPGAASGTAPSGNQVVAEAAQFLGVPYVWGGSTPSGFDCSGLVQYVYGQLGVSLPRTSQEQAQVGLPVSSLADAQPGDLLFFPGSDGTAASPGHVGIYIGNGEMIDAPETGETVSVQSVGTPTAIRRVVADAGATSSLGTPNATLDAAITSSSLPATTSIAASAPTANATSTATEPASSVPADLAPLFVSAAGKYGVPATLLTAVARTESGFDPNAVSSAGAEGLMQLMPDTAASLGVNPFDPTQAVNGAAQLLSGYLKQFGSVPLALAAYNAGPAAVEEYGGVPPYPETEAYVQSITQSLQPAS